MFRLAIPPRLGLAFELLVAVMLIGLGLRNLRTPTHDHGDGRFPTHDRLAARRPLVIGTVHGLAGSAAAALLVLATIRSTPWALAYLAIFGLGTIAGMTVMTLLVATPVRLLGTGRPRLAHRIRLGAGMLSLAFGLVLVHDIVVERGILGSSPAWTPQ